MSLQALTPLLLCIVLNRISGIPIHCRHRIVKMEAPQNKNAGDKLAALNSAAMGTIMPVVTLPDGQKVQTGTVGALIINISHYDELLSLPNPNAQRKSELESMMAASLPVLRKASTSSF